MRSQPLVSVIVNNFNGADYLAEAIDSILGQTWKNFEVIFWDNQSTDNSVNIIQSYSDARLRCFCATSHTPLYHARNLAISECNGELIAFLDSDDLWTPDKLEKQIRLFDDPAVGFVGANYIIFNEITNKRFTANNKPLPNGRVLEELLKDYRLGLLTLMIRKKTFDSLSKPFDPRFHIIGDMDLVIRLAATSKFSYAKEVLAFCRKHQNNASRLGIQTQVKEMEIWEDEMSDDLIIGKYLVSGHFRAHTTYLKGLDDLLNKRRKNAFHSWKKLSIGALKLKLSLAFILPQWLLKKLKQ